MIYSLSSYYTSNVIYTKKSVSTLNSLVSIHIFFPLHLFSQLLFARWKRFAYAAACVPVTNGSRRAIDTPRNELTGIRSDSITRLPRWSRARKNLRNSFLRRSVPLSSLVPSFFVTVPIPSARTINHSALPRSKALCTTTYEFESFYRILIFSRFLCPSLPLECDPTDSRIRCQMLGQGNLRNDRFTTALYTFTYTRARERIHNAAVLFPL